ncbi:MAG: exo-alpha-sialidase [Candidatus Dormibacteraeota bacterium]|nr:exo-alpha-sialidase [Candidatus Dormibacteraeota bacterium]
MKRLMVASAAVCAVAIGLSGTVLAAGVVRVSQGDPYRTCSDAGQTGTINPSAEVEPWVTANPAVPGNLVAAWQQDRWSNGGARGLVSGRSTDDGATWTQTDLPFSACAPGAVNDPFTGAPYDRASDPWVSAGPDGTVYAVGLLATETDGSMPGNNDTGVAAATSSDGGASWQNAQLIKSDQGTSPFFEFTKFFNDKESVTADPVKAGTAYVVWDRLVSPGNSVDAILRSSAFRGPTWFSKTTDGGKTWTGTRAIFDPGQKSQTIGNVVVVDPKTDTIYDFFEQFQSTTNPKVAPRGVSVGFVKSTDGGDTWSGVTTVSNQVLANDTDPNTGAFLRTGNGLPSVAVDPNTGQLYVTWTDARFTSGLTNQAVISTSTDGGASWSAPKLVSNTTPINREAFTVNVAVNSAGTVAVTYYDLRDLTDTNTTTLPTNLWAKTSSDHGVSFGSEIHLAGPFNDLVAPNAGGFMLGDYSGLTTSVTTFEPFFVQTNCNDNSCAEPMDPTDTFATSFTG